MKTTFGLILFFLMVSLKAEVWVYPGPDQALKSVAYEVTVIQNRSEFSSFVYQDANQFIDKKSSMTDFNHWTTFSFSGTITVRVKKLTGDIGSCIIYPLNDNVTPKISGSVLTFTLNEPKKLFLEMEGQYEHPLFIFADAPETNIPDKNNPDVIWYGPGIHNIGPKYQLQSNKTYYFEGGSYVKGSLHGSAVSNVKISGRGILSGIEIAHCGFKSCGFDGVGIHMYDGGINQLIEGITITDPSSYCILSRGQITCRNVKCFGWWYETDGFGAGDNSLLDDSFFKVNDDVVKLYPQNMTIRNLVIYQQMNGAPFQFAWSSQSGRDGSISDIDLIACEVTASPLWTSNKPFINMRNGKNNSVSNFTFSNIRADKDIASLIGINTTGTCSGITIKDFIVRGKQMFASYLKGDTINGITLENVTIGGDCVSQDLDLGLQIQGVVTSVKYVCSSSEKDKVNADSGRNIYPGLVSNSLTLKSEKCFPFLSGNY